MKDPSGASIANVKVTITSTDTGIERTVSSNELGYYTLALLQPGNYKIAYQKEGFRQLTRSGLTLTADQVGRMDVTLELGDVSQSVVVQENVALIQTDRPESSTAMTTAQFDRLPLIQQNRMRNPVGFVYMTPRVQGNVVPDGSDNVGATTQMRFGGGQQFESEVTVDGVVGGRTQLTGSITEAAPPVDAVREFKVTNSLMSAEWGHTGIGVVNLQLKSGTNQFHGTAFEYFRNDKLDARSWLARTRTVTRQNEFGATFGGPIRIPKLYSGKDRSFFFVSYA
ncbi:MAG: carboxypeptidase regulatory-like domain-containing protein, partial [Bryobacteraceae bacterium]